MTVAMTFEEFRAVLWHLFGPTLWFDEHGKDGWTSVEDILERRPGGRPGSHWCDVSERRRGSQWLLAHYDFNTGQAKLFFVDQHWRKPDVIW